MKRCLLWLFMAAMLLMPVSPLFAAETGGSAAGRSQLIALASDALIGAGDRDWAAVSAVVAKLKAQWAASSPAASSPEAKAVNEAFAKADEELAKPQKDDKAAYSAVSALVKAVDAYATAGDSGAAAEKAHKQVRTALIPLLQKSLEAAQAGDGVQAKAAYASFVSGWGKAESLIRQDNAKIYGSMEVKISGARIALNTEPMDTAKAAGKLQELIGSLEAYASGKEDASSDAAGSDGGIDSISGLIGLLDAAASDVEKQRGTEAAASMDRFISAWPALEGAVSTRSPDAYGRIEIKMVEVPSLLLSSPPQWDRAALAIGELRRELEPYAEASSYTAWDAGVIIFREGLEAILIISALVAFLNRSGNRDKRGWIWSGAAAGLVFSVGMALVLTLMLSKLTAGGSRELIEGITGLIAVVFMVSIGAWLHSKSNLKSWNRFVENSIGSSLAKGTLWSLFLTSFLSVMREGAETLIFYMGMAPSISMGDMALGVGTALALLAVIGFVIVKMSDRVPVRPFFLAASVVLYYLAFKFVGVSLHALQVTGHVSAHSSDSLVYLPSLGLYNSWETTLPQLAMLVVIVWNAVRTERKTAGKPVRRAA
ncbi:MULTISPECIES: FTR1 family iron permease [Paenibacillus]|uniref:FTR1 family iron permease n=1 Tax=Paenibacillus TaxID=44249 RepID=UPI0022B86BC8|nr:FTR1 family protein [Paenibacillus caseinilyticus]MCZ8522225.1 FTR1 family iron permease [Paenibacillus caseinilyticus]